MADYRQETDFFHDIVQKVRTLLATSEPLTIAEDKGVGDYATHVDVAVENLVVDEIQKRFPGDAILAEESHAKVAIPKGRIWIIDPICGTSNLGKGINNYCTNIALADGGELVAACVIDHSCGDYFWSVGEGRVYVNDQLHQKIAEDFGIKIDVDFGAIRMVDRATQEKHNRAVLTLVEETEYDLISLNSSLTFAYAAIGKTDGFINVANHPWDIAAASFLIQQSGAIITDMEGQPWSLSSKGAIAGRNREIHSRLLSIYHKS